MIDGTKPRVTVSSVIAKLRGAGRMSFAIRVFNYEIHEIREFYSAVSSFMSLIFIDAGGSCDLGANGSIG